MEPHELTDELILRSLLGELTSEEQAGVSSAISRSAGAAARAQTMRVVLADLAEMSRRQPEMQTTEAQRESLRGLMQAREPGWLTSAVDRAREVVATVVNDSGRVPILGFRGGPGGTTMIRAEADGVSIDLRIQASGTPSDPRVLVQGQITGADSPSGVIATHLESGGIERCDVEPDGYFELGVHPGVQRWEIACKDTVVVIESLDARAGGAPGHETA